jgi:hypothetical protein
VGYKEAGLLVPLIGCGIAVVVVVYLIGVIFRVIAEILVAIYVVFEPVWVLISENYFLIGGLLLWAAAIFIWVYFKPHPAKKYIEAYKSGRVTRRVAIEKIANTMYNPLRDNIPSVQQNKSLERRLKALRSRVNIETEFMEDLIKYMRTKAKIEGQ